MVRLPSGGFARVPYCLPYVQPSIRMSLPISSEVAFSAGVWRLNEELSPAITVSEASPEARAFLEYLGFSSSDELADVARWHYEHLACRAGGALR